mmetsp:Transcript_26648/g.43572  ORF Transcript_26648/g.43572 Transcript_26648/m.43572 type:complete len:220 (-) Transcript_26648:456-1115(-)
MHRIPPALGCKPGCNYFPCQQIGSTLPTGFVQCSWKSLLSKGTWSGISAQRAWCEGSQFGSADSTKTVAPHPSSELIHRNEKEHIQHVAACSTNPSWHPTSPASNGRSQRCNRRNRRNHLLHGHRRHRRMRHMRELASLQSSCQSCQWCQSRKSCQLCHVVFHLAPHSAHSVHSVHSAHSAHSAHRHDRISRSSTSSRSKAHPTWAAFPHLAQYRNRQR